MSKVSLARSRHLVLPALAALLSSTAARAEDGATGAPAPTEATSAPVPTEATSAPVPTEATSAPVPTEATNTPAPHEATNTPAPHEATNTPPPADAVAAAPAAVAAAPAPVLETSQPSAPDSAPAFVLEAPLPKLFGRSPMRDRGPDDTESHYDPEARYRGIYGRLDLLGAAFGTSRVTSCEGQPGCDASSVYGAWAGLRIGYSFGWLGVEAGGMVVGDIRLAQASSGATANAEVPAGLKGMAAAAEQPHYVHYGVTGLLGVGPRVKTKGVVRFTLGFLPGLAIHTRAEHRQVGIDSADASTSYESFAFAADAGLELGATPGVRVYAGVVAFADFASGSREGGRGAPGAVASASPPDVKPEAQLYVGPMLGFQFGH